MDNHRQVEVVKEVLDLEIYVSNTSQRLSTLKSEQFRKAPAPPVKTTIKRTYPEIQSSKKFSWIVAIIICIPFTLIGSLIYYFIMKSAEKRDIERIRNSAEYKGQCARLDAAYDRQQAAANQKYQAEKMAYDTQVMPAYRSSLNEWTIRQKQKILQTERDLADAQNRLKMIYQTTKVIPVQYRTIDAISYIYDMISTSDYDIKQAIENYDRKSQRELDKARLRAQQRANRIADEQSALLDEQNALLDQQNMIADQARHEARQAAIVAAVQRHNTNKLLKERNEKLR